jgi:hypothetical protein
MPSKLEQFQARVKLCRDYAVAAESAAVRDQWLKLAEQWAEMAEVEATRAMQERPRHGATEADDRDR